MGLRLAAGLLCVGLLLTACGGAGGTGLPADLEADLLDIAECTGFGLEDVILIFYAILELQEVVADDTIQPPNWINYNRSTGDFSVGVDFDGNGSREGSIAGTIRNPSDFDDGFQISEAMVIEWGVTAGSASGSGIFSIVRLGATEYQMTIVDEDTVLTGTGCEFRITSLMIGFDENTVEDEGVFGSLEFTVTAGGADPFDGLLTFVLNDDVAYAMGSYRGFDFEFNIDLDTFAIYL